MPCSCCKHQTTHPLFMAFPHQLCNCAAHGISHRDKCRNAQLIGEAGCVVGAIGETKWFRTANAATMATMVKSNDAKMFAQCAVTHKPVQVSCRCPAVEQDNSGRPGRSFNLAEKSRASPGKMEMTSEGQIGEKLFAQLVTFTIDTETFAPFSNVMLTVSPSVCPRRAEPIGDAGLMISKASLVRFSSM